LVLNRALNPFVAAERGFTTIELLMAMLLAAVAMMALVSTIDGSRKLTGKAERQETAAHQAEREMERILGLPYSQVALDANPGTSTDEDDPRFYVSLGAPPRYQWDQGSTGPRFEDLVVDPVGGALAPRSAWSDGQSRLRGHIHRFVTRTGDLCTAAPACAGVQSAKRVTIAVTVEGANGLEPLVLISSLKIDPTSTG
jgi:type II secretory pathway pseudopilin PulG